MKIRPELHVERSVNCMLSLADFNQIKMTYQVFFVKFSSIVFHLNSFSGLRIVTSGRTERMMEREISVDTPLSFEGA